MTTLICDICGTSYPDTEAKCPTCGYSRAFEEEQFENRNHRGEHPKVKGGFFSHKNVQKRLEQRHMGEVLVEDIPDFLGPQEALVQDDKKPVERDNQMEVYAQAAQKAAASKRRLNVILIVAIVVFVLSCGYIVVQYGIPYIKQMPWFDQFTAADFGAWLGQHLI